MTGNRYLLDTNIISAWLKKEVPIAVHINNAEQIFIPIIALGEMYYGAQFSIKKIETIRNISMVTQSYPVLSITERSCETFGLIKAALRKKGKPIPENDIWIAAIAKEKNLIVVTRDNHFTEIEGLNIETW